MIKVLQIGMSYEVGGTEVFIYNHYKVINKSEFQFDFVAYRDTIGFEEEVKQLGANVYQVKSAKKNPFLSYYQLSKLLEEHNYDVVHINISSFANIIPLLVAKQKKTPLIILHSHNNGMDNNCLKIVLHNINKHLTEKMSLKRLACSESAGKFMFGKASFEVFENAIDPTEFTYDEEKRNELRKKLNIPSDSFVIGTVGRLHPQKNQKFLIDIFSKYLKINPSSYLLIVGKGFLREELQKQVKELGIEERVIFTGFQNNVAPFYQVMDVFCLPSIYEGLGIVGIEAQMNGLPCIFSDKCVAEVDISNQSVFLSLSNEGSWLETLEYLHQNKSVINRNNQPTKYNLNENIKKLELIYKVKK